MKFIHLVCLTSLVWLTGCATTGIPTAIAPAAGTESTGLTPPGSRSFSTYGLKPIIPGGILLPIKATQAGSEAVAQLSPPADLWDRMRLGFGMPDIENNLVRDSEQWYSTRPDYMLRMTERSRKYLFHIVEELEMRNMPTELALLPFIESAFNPLAVSSANAVGMWQFMPATGRHFELKQNAFRDDRRDVLASTRAALDYLQRLHTMFGDWHLALAAYNWGEGSVGRAIAKNQRAGLGTAYSDLDMPTETRFYVPKLLAMKNIVTNPEAFNSRLPLIENHPYFQSVDITRDIDVALAAKLAEIPLEDFKALNPAANRPVIFAAGTPQILLPWDNATIFQDNLEAYTGGHLASWTVWIAPTTLNPAAAARRVGMSESELRSINKIPPRVLIKAGSSLLVTRAKNSDKEVTEHTADNGQLALMPEVLLKRTVLKAGKKDSVASLAQRFRVSPASVADWNKVSTSAAFKAGQQIVLFLPTQTRSVRAKRAVNR
jgi:membrane-bound lytic murein transglycosylase D